MGLTPRLHIVGKVHFSRPLRLAMAFKIIISGIYFQAEADRRWFFRQHLRIELRYYILDLFITGNY